MNQLKSSGNENAAKAIIAEQMEHVIILLMESAIDLSGYQKKNKQIMNL